MAEETWALVYLGFVGIFESFLEEIGEVGIFGGGSGWVGESKGNI